jgi:transposase
MTPATAPTDTPPVHGYTTRDVARRYRVGEDKVRGWIRRGELAAVNTSSALCGKPRWIVLPDALAAFERRRSASPPPKVRHRRRVAGIIDYYPDHGGGGPAT